PSSPSPYPTLFRSRWSASRRAASHTPVSPASSGRAGGRATNAGAAAATRSSAAAAPPSHHRRGGPARAASSASIDGYRSDGSRGSPRAIARRSPARAAPVGGGALPGRPPFTAPWSDTQEPHS